MPNRTLKETIVTSERLAGLSFEAETLFYRLLVCADDFGRFDARPIIIRSRAMPLRDVCLSSVSQWVDELRASDLLTVYEVNGKPYLQLHRWEQRTRAAKSKFPDPPTSAPVETKTCEKNDGQVSDERLSTDSQPSPEVRGTRYEERGTRVARKTRKTPIPADFGISERVAKWAESKGHDRLTERLEQFIGAAKARGYEYADWDEALMNAIRDDWAKFGKSGSAATKPGGGRRPL